MRSNQLILALAATLLLFSCKKADFEPEGELLPVEANSDYSMFVEEPFRFDWESADFMPQFPGEARVLVPWGSGSSSTIPSEILLDFKKVDGWELLYNTFSPDHRYNDKYFILYNKFRGIMRLYFYTPSNIGYTPSTNIVHSLAIEGTNTSSSPMMNFAATTLIDFNNNIKKASVLEHSQVAVGTWYAFEYELAYDPLIKSRTYDGIHFRWPFKANSVSSVKLNGQTSGEVLGRISVPGIDLTLNANASFSNSTIGDGSLVIKGMSDVEKARPKLSDQLYSSLKSLVTQHISSGAGGVIRNLLSGIFGGRSDIESDNVNLRIKSNIEVQGSLESESMMSTPLLAVPGARQEDASGFVPLYNEPLGVFYISAKPKVKRHVQSRLLEDGMTYEVRQQYAVDVSSFEVIFNDALYEEVDFSNVHFEVLLFDLPPHTIERYGNEEHVGDETLYSGTNPFFSFGWPRPRTMDLDTVGVRVSFYVVPKNGAKKTKIVKSFKADVI